MAGKRKTGFCSVCGDPVIFCEGCGKESLLQILQLKEEINDERLG
jgi:hypothetical protein